MVRPLPEDKAADVTVGQTQINVPSPDSVTYVAGHSDKAREALGSGPAGVWAEWQSAGSGAGDLG